ncbi:MAG: Coq4 family protein [Pseudomonadota bacterium]
MRRLIDDKEDTEQVFHILAALNGADDLRATKAMLDTPQGMALAQRGESLIPFLDDHDALERFEEGTLGHAYLTFMRREGLTASGLEAEELKYDAKFYDDVMGWYNNRRRDLHDLIHVLTGYSRGAFGEVCNLAFSYRMNRGGIGDLFIALAGVVELKRHFPHVPLVPAFREALRNGRAAELLYLADIEELFALPLAEAQRRMGIRPSPLYQEARRAIEASPAAQQPALQNA